MTPEEFKRTVKHFVAMDWNNEYRDLEGFIYDLVHKAHIAGAESTKGIGLNLSKEERAEEYCKRLGLRP